MKEDVLTKSDFFVDLSLELPPEFHGCGCFVADHGWVHSRRSIDTWEILLGLKGSLGLSAGGRDYQLNQGDVLLFKPQVEHYGTSPASAGNSFYWAHFRPRLSVSGLSSTRISLPLFLPGAGTGKVLASMMSVQEASANLAGSKYICDYHIGTFLLELEQTTSPETSTTNHALSWLHSLLEWMRLHPLAILSVRDMAIFANRHPDYLARVFRRYLGSSPLEFIHKQRLELAKQRLLESNLSIKKLAWDLAWPDVSQFSRFFRAGTGMGPREFRETYSRIRYNRI